MLHCFCSVSRSLPILSYRYQFASTSPFRTDEKEKKITPQNELMRPEIHRQRGREEKYSRNKNQVRSNEHEEKKSFIFRCFFFFCFNKVFHINIGVHCELSQNSFFFPSFAVTEECLHDLSSVINGIDLLLSVCDVRVRSSIFRVHLFDFDLRRCACDESLSVFVLSLCEFLQFLSHIVEHLLNSLSHWCTAHWSKTAWQQDRKEREVKKILVLFNLLRRTTIREWTIYHCVNN